MIRKSQIKINRCIILLKVNSMMIFNNLIYIPFELVASFVFHKFPWTIETRWMFDLCIILQSLNDLIALFVCVWASLGIHRIPLTRVSCAVGKLSLNLYRIAFIQAFIYHKTKHLNQLICRIIESSKHQMENWGNGKKHKNGETTINGNASTDNILHWKHWKPRDIIFNKL